MTGYQWPSVRREKVDDPRGRAAFLAPIRRDFAPDAALAAGRRVAAPAARRRRGGPEAAPSGRQHLWVPLGPTTVVQGQAEGDPRVAGRIKSLHAHPGGERIYAGAANGGVWYSSDGGGSWRSLGGFAATNIGEIRRPAHRHACGAIFVVFGATEIGDEVFVGTGETSHQHRAQPGNSLGGVGILVSQGPVTTAETGNPWSREAPNLIGEGVNRFAMSPDGATIVAATSIGLLQRPDPPEPDAEWTRVDGTPFDDLETPCSDVLWTAADGTRPERLWVWVKGGEHSGLWVRAADETDFSPVATAGSSRFRGVLAAAEPPATVYVLNDRHDPDNNANSQPPALFRVAAASEAAPAATIVADVPDVLGVQGFYDMAIAVHPTNPARVVLAGGAMDLKSATGADIWGTGAVCVADVGMKGPTLTYGHATAPAMLGIGLHADVHDIQFSNNGDRLWAGCDGGVFRSDRPSGLAGFRPCNDGLSVVEANFIASHPTCEGYVAAGLQDNGVIERASTGVWLHTGDGDGGGIVFDTVLTSRFLRQFFNGNWTMSAGTTSELPLRRAGHGDDLPAALEAESAASAFYSSAAAIRHTRGGAAVGQLLLGTTRPWYSEDQGQSWVTLPTGDDPVGVVFDASQDSFGQQIRVCRWQSPDVAWVLGESRLARLARAPGSDDDAAPGTWTRERLITRDEKEKKDDSGEVALQRLTVWTDIAVNLEPGATATDPGVQRGAKGALYLGTIGDPADERLDTLWWFDGDATWHRTGLRSDSNGVAAPVTAIVCDHRFPNEVYVGTTVGVWKGTRTITDGTPTWAWQSRVNGLPEAAVEDLSIYSHVGLRLLRAGIASRGVWELRLDQPDVEDKTFLRCHGDDLRYRTSALLERRDGTADRSWHASPDVRPRPAPAAVALPTTLPWNGNTSTTNMPPPVLRRFQAALRARTGDLRIRATGQWDWYFEELLRDHGAPVVGLRTNIDEALWNATMVAPHVTAEPWATTLPTEADLYDLTPALSEGSVVEAASCTVTAGPAKVDIVVHHRGLEDVEGGDVRVTLLRWIDPTSPPAANPWSSATWAPSNVPADAVNEVLNSAGATTSVSLDGTGWAFAGTTAATRRTALTFQRLDNDTAGIATFDLDLTGTPSGTLVLLLAVIRAGGASAIASLPLQQLTVSDHHVAVRSIVIA